MAAARRKIAAISAAVSVTVALISFSEATTSRAVAAVDPECGPSPSAAYTTCLFHDTFAGGQDGITLNGANWSRAKNYRLASGACLKEAYVTVGGGTLNLKSEVLATAMKCTPLSLAPASRFVGGSVTTDAKFAHTYGRIEFKAALPSSNTVNHTALWMNPTKLTYGKWPKSGEIDVMERFAPPLGNANTAVQSIHYQGQTANSGTCAISSPEEFHLYGVEWSPSRIRFYIDNQLCTDLGWTPTNVKPPKPFDHPFNLVATQASGGDASTPAGNERVTRIDWVKFWG
jgi:beta-glucanase (GH16 family)